MFARNGSTAAGRLRVRQLLIVGPMCTLVETAASFAQPVSPAQRPAASVDAVSSSRVSNLGDALSGQAKQEYEAARLLYLDGDAASASVKFQSAYDLSHEPRLLWNLAACQKQLRHYAALERLLKRYLAEGNSVITETDRTEANALLQTIAPLLTDATIQVNEPGATIYVDDAAIGQSPLPEVARLDLGSRKIRVEKPGFVTYEVTVPVGGGVAIALDVKLAKDLHEGKLRVIADGGAQIRVDGQSRGFGVWMGVLPSGAHAVEVSATGKLPYHSEVVVSDNQTNTLRAMLENRTSTEPGFDTTWLWVAGSAVLAAGLGIAGYYEFGPSHQSPSSPVGSFAPGTVQLSFVRH